MTNAFGRRTRAAVLMAGVGWAALGSPVVATAQSVCLPAPRLLTTVPMGGQVGASVEITITGEHLDGADELVFSDPRLTAARKLDAAGKPEPNRYVVSISPECPAGLYEARVMTRLGLSSSRIFSVGTLAEVTRTQPATTLAQAMELKLNTVCNAVLSTRGVDHYAFNARRGQRVVVDCLGRGIDSKIDGVLVVADAAGRDLLVERRSGRVDFTAPADGRYVVKVHDMTFKGGADYFYRLALREFSAGAPVTPFPATRTVSSFSWPPEGLPASAAIAEASPEDAAATPQAVTLPLDVAGSFFPAADVDAYEFDAKKGEEWWVEVGSERFGLPTDPAVVVQRVTGSGADEKLVDVAELADIPSPVKVSSNGYAYDGPPYNAGSSDVLGKLTIPEDGRYRLQVSDLFGGTRNDPRNVYRLVVRKAAPDFALVAWGLHQELRNGDRNALSKPVALRGGATMALEVIAVRRDGFDGDIDLTLDGLPAGVTAQGLKIPAGKSRGIMLVTAAADAPRAFTLATFTGRGTINGAAVTRPCRLASVPWPIPDSWGEIPAPRLLADVPVSVGGVDQSPITIAEADPQPREVVVGGKLTIPLKHVRRSEFSGETMQLKTFGAGFEHAPPFNIKLTEDASEATFDLAALKTPPGEYRIAFYGPAVAKYRHHPEAVPAAKEAVKTATADLQAAETELKQATEAGQSVTAEQKAAADQALAAATARQKSAAAAVAAANERLKQATATAQPRDIVDIVVSEPITVRVKPAEAP